MKKVCRSIQLPQQICEKVKKAGEELDFEKLNPILDRLMNQRDSEKAYLELKETLGKDRDCMKMLACQLTCVARDEKKYLAEGISETVFTETMKCFTRFLKERKERTGEEIFDRGWWTWRQVSMRLFRIGELEYELTTYEGEKAVSIHISSDAVLIPEKSERSFREAKEFISRYASEYSGCIYFCESWLLSPRLVQILGEESNIRKFQKLFVLKKDLPEDREYMEWLFGKTSDTPLEELPEKTSLQRKVKEILRAGGNLGAGIGILS